MRQRACLQPLCDSEIPLWAIRKCIGESSFKRYTTWKPARSNALSRMEWEEAQKLKNLEMYRQCLNVVCGAGQLHDGILGKSYSHF